MEAILQQMIRLRRTPDATVLKSVTVIDNGDTFDGLDDLLQYEIEIKNTGDVTLTKYFTFRLTY